MAQNAPLPYKIYVTLGFHTSFHHSWRGDTPDEAGFGTDIRVVRGMVDILDAACAQGLQARGYWDLDVYWTLEQILPRHAPDIVDRIRARVQAGLDGLVLGYYNNGANHAATEPELRTAVAFAVENPAGSGYRQVFGCRPSILRPQESMYTAGMNRILLEEGIDGVVLYYAGVPFNALSTFVPALPPEQRYNPFWLRCQPDEPPIVAWPCISPADLVEEVCLEALMLKLRRLQTSGRVQSDLLIHLNFDADSDTWLPIGLPRAFSWLPNTGGLWETIRTVDRYPWAEFTLPEEYRSGHPPQGEVLVGQDLADGGFDGNYSWAEKHSSLLNWTQVERSRLCSYRAEALTGRLSEAQAQQIRNRLWQGPHSAFFKRLVGLTATHFGMSTPVINDQRQEKAERLLGAAVAQAERAERDAARARRDQHPAEAGLLYAVEVYEPSAVECSRPAPAPSPLASSRPRDAERVTGAATAMAVVRLPIILPHGIESAWVEDAGAQPVAASLVEVRSLPDGSRVAQLLFLAPCGMGTPLVYRVRSGESPLAGSARRPQNWDIGRPAPRLANRWLELELSDETGIASLTFEGQSVGGADFLAPFIGYRSARTPRTWSPPRYVVGSLAGETWYGLQRAQLQTSIEMETQAGPAATRLKHTFSLFDGAPYLLVDVEVDYAATLPREEIATVQQKLRRLLDLRWIEVAPFQLHPAFGAAAGRPFRVWKHNYLGVTSYYEVDYGRVNPRNRQLDAFNHQVTAGWLAVSNGRQGLLLAECADSLSSMAFCPMRLREEKGIQRLWLNPFGSYYGRQLDYRHLAGSGLGADLTAAVSGALRPNGPSFNGQSLRFALLVAPYSGDVPPDWLRAAADAFFHPPGSVYLQSPPGVELLLGDDVHQRVEADEAVRQRIDVSGLPTPRAVLASPAAGGVDLAWEAVRDRRVVGYEVRWRRLTATSWRSERTPTRPRWEVAGLEDGQDYCFQVRALSTRDGSEWSAVAQARPGAVKAASLLGAVPAGSWRTLARVVCCSLWHTLWARLRGRM